MEFTFHPQQKGDIEDIASEHKEPIHNVESELQWGNTNPLAYLEETVKHSHDLVVSVPRIISFINGYERWTLPGYLSFKVTMIFF
jgi:hypothetical protein